MPGIKYSRQVCRIHGSPVFGQELLTETAIGMQFEHGDQSPARKLFFYGIHTRSYLGRGMGKIAIYVTMVACCQQFQSFGRARERSDAFEKIGGPDTQFLTGQPGSLQVEQVMVA